MESHVDGVLCFLLRVAIYGLPILWLAARIGPYLKRSGSVSQPPHPEDDLEDIYQTGREARAFMQRVSHERMQRIKAHAQQQQAQAQRRQADGRHAEAASEALQALRSHQRTPMSSSACTTPPTSRAAQQTGMDPDLRRNFDRWVVGLPDEE